MDKQSALWEENPKLTKHFLLSYEKNFASGQLNDALFGTNQKDVLSILTISQVSDVSSLYLQVDANLCPCSPQLYEVPTNLTKMFHLEITERLVQTHVMAPSYV